MKTFLTHDVSVAAMYIRRGGIVAFPTETVYGLAASLYDPAAITRIFEAKGRPPDNPLIVHIGSQTQLFQVAKEIGSAAGQFIDAFFPGPLTLVLEKRPDIPAIVTAGLDTVGVRMPGNEVGQRFIQACGEPVVAPSANLSGRPSPTTWEAVWEDLEGKIDCILQGDPTEIGLESTVVDCTGTVPVLLRKGAISLEKLRSVVPETIEYSGEGSVAARSPGLRHKHYSPRARVVLLFDDSIDIPQRAAFIGIVEPAEDYELTRIVASAEEYAKELFEFFRECDRAGIETIFCEPVPESGIAAALMDRLRRAAED